MISYAQNYEDVMLARAFAQQSSGFYIDVGVWHPTDDSVTKHFYDLGWSGINVEALPEQHALIAAERPRDTNLQLAVSTSAGPLTMHRVPGTGLSTSLSFFADQHAKAGFSVEAVDVPTATLRQICEQYASGRVIDFLKIDVEGAEADVIASGDWKRFRPRVLLVEATIPNSPVESYADWDPALTSADYRFVYFDGLNRWYVAAECDELRAAFKAPPNVFDRFVVAEHEALRREVARLRAAQAKPSLLRRVVNRLSRA